MTESTLPHPLPSAGMDGCACPQRMQSVALLLIVERLDLSPAVLAELQRPAASPLALELVIKPYVNYYHRSCHSRIYQVDVAEKVVPFAHFPARMPQQPSAAAMRPPPFATESSETSSLNRPPHPPHNPRPPSSGGSSSSHSNAEASRVMNAKPLQTILTRRTAPTGGTIDPNILPLTERVVEKGNSSTISSPTQGGGSQRVNPVPPHVEVSNPPDFAGGGHPRPPPLSPRGDYLHPADVSRASADAWSVGGSGSPHRSMNYSAFSRCGGVDGGGGGGGGGRAGGRADHTAGGGAPSRLAALPGSHRLRLRYPARDDLKVVIEVQMGVRLRLFADDCAGSKQFRWLEPVGPTTTSATAPRSPTAAASPTMGAAGHLCPLEDDWLFLEHFPTSSPAAHLRRRSELLNGDAGQQFLRQEEKYAMLLSYDEVARHKVVSRHLNLAVGSVHCTLQIPYVSDSIRAVPKRKRAGHVRAVLRRLLHDAERLEAMYGSAAGRSYASNHVNDGLSRFGSLSAQGVAVGVDEDRGEVVVVEELLRHGDRTALRAYFSELVMLGHSELSLYRLMVLFYRPSCYQHRVEQLLQQASASAVVSAYALCERYVGKEPELMRELNVVLGPSPSASSPYHRLHRYLSAHPSVRLSDISATLAEAAAPDGTHIPGITHVLDLLEGEPEWCFEQLCARFGSQEPAAREYHVAVPPRLVLCADTRGYLYEALPTAAEVGSCPASTALTASTGSAMILLRLDRRPTGAAAPRSTTSSSFVPLHSLVTGIVRAVERVVQRAEHLLRTSPAWREWYAELRPSLSGFRATVLPTSPGKGPADRSVVDQCLSRLVTGAAVSPCVLLAGVIYLDRLCLRCPALLLTEDTCLLLLLTAVRVGSKELDLRCMESSKFASLFGLTEQQLHHMEGVLINMMQLELFVSVEEFELYAHKLCGDRGSGGSRALPPCQGGSASHSHGKRSSGQRGSSSSSAFFTEADRHASANAASRIPFMDNNATLNP